MLSYCCQTLENARMELDLIRNTALVSAAPPVWPMKEVSLSALEEFPGVLEVAQLLVGFYTVQSAAKKLGLERQTVYDLVESGNLEGGRVVDADGALIKVLVSKRSVEAYATWRAGKANRPSYA